MILVHIPRLTARLNYIFDFILKEILRAEYSLTNDKDAFLNYQGPKFSYGKNPFGEDTIHFGSSNILFETEIHQQDVASVRWKNFKVIFPVNSGVLPFDPFGCSFFLVSRYEEYLPHIKDKHKRFNPDDSVAFMAGFLENPVVNIWAIEIKNIILQKYPQVEFPPIPFTFTPSIDIDNAYAYKYKGFLRNAVSLVLKLFKLQFGKFYRRMAVISGYKEDPFDTYEKQHRIHAKYNLNPLYFILLGDYTRFDKNLSHNNPQMISLIQQLGKVGHIGLHPSYSSKSLGERMEKEKARLEKIVGRKVTKSRHHYIRINIPTTYRELMKLGIYEDYSMGYTSKAGYRASTCTPFYFFDLENDAVTKLKVHPFIVMDTMLKVYMKLRSKEVLPYIKTFVDEVKTLGGNVTFIFHNESMRGDRRMWRNWEDMYERVIKLMLPNKNEI